jgi:hypothetical protein
MPPLMPSCLCRTSTSPCLWPACLVGAEMAGKCALGFESNKGAAFSARTSNSLDTVLAHLTGTCTAAFSLLQAIVVPTPCRVCWRGPIC